MLIVPFEELEESEYDCFQDVTYKGKPFTGIGFEKTEKFITKYSYKDGKGHGRCFSMSHSGQLLEEFDLYEGEEVGDSYQWYPTGQLKSHSNSAFNKKWTEDGVLLYDYDLTNEELKEYYTTGELMTETSSTIKACSDSERKYSLIYYAKDGAWFAKVDAYNLFYYNDLIIQRNWDALCFEDSFRSILTTYFKEQLVNNRSIALNLLFRMFEHPNLRIKDSAISLAGNLKIAEALPYLHKFLGDDRKPEDQYDRYTGFPSISWGRTLAEQAKYSLSLFS